VNLHGIASAAVSAINPMVKATYRQSAGYTTDATFKQVPAYLDKSVSVQMQMLSGSQLAQLNGLNIQGVLRSLYVAGEVQGVVRPRAEGGDLFIINGETWLVVQVLETWPEWSKVAICLQ
jgi:hypothetical protein